MTTAGSDLGEQARRLLPVVAGTLLEFPFEGWHFGDSVAFEAMIAADDALGSAEHAAFARGFVLGWASRVHDYRPLDCTAAGHAMVGLAQRAGDQRMLDAARSLAQYLVTRRKMSGVYATWERSPLRLPYGPRPLNPEELELLEDPGAGVFVDCLHFDPPFFAALGRATGEQRWSDEAVSQALAYVALLQHEGGLFHHFRLEKTGCNYVLGWGRGQGWALLGLLDVIEALPDHAGTPRLRVAAASLVSALLTRQRPDGQWDAVVGESRSGDETSTAAFLVHGFRRAARLGVVPAGHVQGAVTAALRSTLSLIGENGVLGGVSAEVWACTLDDHYWHVPRGFVVPWGQGPAALALADIVLYGVDMPGGEVAGHQQARVAAGTAAPLIGTAAG